MYSSVLDETVFFMASTLAGVAAAFLYDLLRISRRVKRPRDAVVNIEDVLFLMASAGIIFYAAFRKNFGEVRWQSFIGFFLGAGTYAFVVRNRFLNASEILIKWTVRVVGVAVKTILFPVRLILRIFKRPVGVVAWYTGESLRKTKRFAKNRGYKLKMSLRRTAFLLRKK